jgi:hypothetical protein
MDGIMSTEAMTMAKGKTNGGNALTLQGYEQSTLRILLAAREQDNASLAASSGAVRNYLIQLLQGRGLDPQKWGVSPDMSSFVEIQAPVAAPGQPGAPAPDAAATPGAPAAFVPPSAPAAAPAAS